MKVSSHRSPSLVTLRNLLALASFEVVWLPESKRSHLDKHLDLKNKPLDFVARVAFGEPDRATSVSLFYLERSRQNEDGALREKIVPLGDYTDLNRALDELQKARFKQRENLQPTNENFDDAVKAGFPQNYAEPGHRISTADFEGKSPFHFFIQAKGNDRWNVFWRTPGESRVRDNSFRIGPGWGAWSLEEAPSRIRKFLMGEAVWPHVRNVVRKNDSLSTVEDDSPVLRSHFFSNENVAVDRIIFRPNFHNASVEAFALNPETCDPTKTIIAFEDFPRIEEITEGLCAQQFSNFFCALEKLKASVGDKFLEASGSTPTLVDGDYRVYVDTQKLRVEVLYKVPGLETRKKTTLGLNPVAVDCLVQEAIEEQRKGKEVGEVLASLRDAVCVHPGKNVGSRHFKRKSPGHVILRPDTGFTRCTIFYMNPGESSSRYKSVSRAQKIPEEVREIRKVHEAFNRSLEEVKAFLGDKFVKRSSRLPRIGDGDYRIRLRKRGLQAQICYKLPGVSGIRKKRGSDASLATVKILVENAREVQERAKAFWDLMAGMEGVSGISFDTLGVREKLEREADGHVYAKASNDQFTSFTLLWIAPGGFGDVSSTSVPLSGIVKGVRKAKREMAGEDRVQLNMTGLSKTGTASKFTIPPAPAGVSYRQLLDLRKELYHHTGRPGINFSWSQVDNLEDSLKNFVAQVRSDDKFTSWRQGYQPELAERVRTLVRLVISGLQRKSDPALTYSVLKAFADASFECSGRYLAAAAQEYMNVHDCWDKQFAGQWDERIRCWIDELKVGIATEMVRKLGHSHNMHTRNYFLRSLDQNGIKIPPSPGINFDDPYLTFDTGGYEASQVVRRFKWDFGGALVEAIRDKANDAMVKDNVFCQQVLDGLHEHAEKYVTIAEDERKMAEAKKKGVGEAFASAKKGVLQNRIFEAELVEWTDDTFTHIRLTPEGTKALLH